MNHAVLRGDSPFALHSMMALLRKNLYIGVLVVFRRTRLEPRFFDAFDFQKQFMRAHLLLKSARKDRHRARDRPERDRRHQPDHRKREFDHADASTGKPADLIVRRMPAMLPSRARALFMVFLVGIGCLPWRAEAQLDGAPPPNMQAGTTAPPRGIIQLPGEVQIDVDQFGVGGVVRPGDFAGIRLVLTDRGDRVRDAIVRIHLPDPDGDEMLIDRVITLNPGRPQPLWISLRLPVSFDRQSLLTVTVHETADDGAGVGAQIAVGQIAPQRVVPMKDGLIGVVGRRGAGLEDYTVRDDSGTPTPTTNELIDVVTGIEPAGLPDDWFGYAPYEALVWMDGDPTALRTDQAAAMKEWILHGGRLVVVLPGVGQVWNNPVNPLFEIMPPMRLERREGVDLDAYRSLLLDRSNLPLPRTAIVHVFERVPTADPMDAIPILDGPDGAAIAVRRLFGLGDITIVGLDLNSPALTGRIDAQILWHRLLGHRFDVRSRAELTEEKQRGFPRPDDVVVDAPFASIINKTGSAGVGVLLGLIVFALYFLIAGPLGYAILNRFGWRRHAWLAFVGVAGVFTAIAWVGAFVVRPRTISILHVTFLDGVHGQDLVRASSWFSVLLPTYGAQTISASDPQTAGGPIAHRNRLWPWQDPTALGVRAAFPDRRSYGVDARRPDSMRVPTRSTVKEFEAEWIGPPMWRLPRPAQADIRLDDNGALVGAIIHELPAALENVVIVLNRGQTPLVELRDGGPLLANIWAWSPLGSSSWPPGAELDLSRLSYRDATLGEKFFSDITRGMESLIQAIADGESFSRSRLDRSFDAITWFSALEPPNWKKDLIPKTIPHRVSAHSLDLGRWLTQPCLIVVGQLPESSIPAPITVDGETPPSSGRTIIRWVYPLAPNPPRPMRDGAM